MVNRITLQGTVSDLRLVHDEATPSCDHQYFDINFEGGLCLDRINVCDWTNVKLEDGDKVLVTGTLQSNERDVTAGIVEGKSWWVMVSDTSDGSVIKLA